MSAGQNGAVVERVRVALAAGETLLVVVGVGRDAEVAVAESGPALGLAVDGLVGGAGGAEGLEGTRVAVDEAEDVRVLVADPLPLWNRVAG